jgi:hypothetical protein
MRHKHADLIHAWAEGAKVLKKTRDAGWIPDHNPTWREDGEYCLAPKPKVKKWKWVIKHLRNSNLAVSSDYYATEEDANRNLPMGEIAIQRIDSTEI